MEGARLEAAEKPCVWEIQHESAVKFDCSDCIGQSVVCHVLTSAFSIAQRLLVKKISRNRLVLLVSFTIFINGNAKKKNVLECKQLNCTGLLGGNVAIRQSHLITRPILRRIYISKCMHWFLWDLPLPRVFISLF